MGNWSDLLVPLLQSTGWSPARNFSSVLGVSAAALQPLGGVPSLAWWGWSAHRLEALQVFVWIQASGNKLVKEKAGREH